MNLDSERDALRAQSADFEVLRQQHLIELRDCEARIAADRCDLGLAQGELGATRRQFDQEFARLADERDRLDSEREALRTQSAEFENLRQQHLVDSRERETRIDEDRRTLVHAHGELLTARQQLEPEFTRLADERDRLSSEWDALRDRTAELENVQQQQLVDSRNREVQIDEDRRALVLAEADLLTTRQQLELDRTRLASERSADSIRREQEQRELSGQPIAVKR